MIPVQPLLTSANTAISNLTGTSCSLDYLRLLSISKDSTNGYCYSVANTASLPTASCNKGRIVYVQDICAYRISDGTQWTNDFTSTATLGIAYSWGANDRCQLGDGTTTSRSSPVSVVGGFTDWCQIEAGYEHTIALRRNGTAWAWGRNNVGQLGDNTIVNKCSPVSVVGGFTDWCQIDGGYRHSVGLRTNGSLWAWGYNNFGQLGDGTSGTNVSSPVSVVGGFTDWRQVSSNGSNGTFAIRSNATLWAWGSNYCGQLGDGTELAKSSPVSVIGGFTDWCQVVGSTGFFALGLRTNCTLWSWGRNVSGQLGDDSTVAKSSPVSVVGGFTDWCQVNAGFGHAIALRTNGSLWAWGANERGQLGDGTATSRSSPVSVVGGFTDWCLISGGARHSLGIRTNGTLWAWGQNANRELADGTSASSKTSPVSVIGGISSWCRVSGGYRSSHAITVAKGF